MINSIVVAVQGGAASYHDQVARAHFGQRYEPLHCKTFEAVFAELLHGTAAYGVVAINNTIYGEIGEARRLLHAAGQSVRAVARLELAIHHCLIGLPGAKLQDVRRVHSQYMALAQCNWFLQEAVPQAARVSEPDTAESVALIKARGNRADVAVASAVAAELYGMQILQEHIEDDPSNKTTFLVLQSQHMLRRFAGQVTPASSASFAAASGPHELRA